MEETAVRGNKRSESITVEEERKKDENKKRTTKQNSPRLNVG
jgi:hypothetical protein